MAVNIIVEHQLVPTGDSHQLLPNNVKGLKDERRVYG